jgi:hypothetical protein
MKRADVEIAAGKALDLLGLSVGVKRKQPGRMRADTDAEYRERIAVWCTEGPAPPPPTEAAEVRVVNEKTGGEKGSKLARFDLVPVEPLILLAEHFGRGARKYADRNWEKGYDWSLSFAAMMRHAWAFWSGEDIDPETGSPHIIAVAWHAFALAEFMRRHPELDNRPKRAPRAVDLDTERHPR